MKYHICNEPNLRDLSFSIPNPVFLLYWNLVVFMWSFHLIRPLRLFQFNTHTENDIKHNWKHNESLWRELSEWEISYSTLWQGPHIHSLFLLQNPRVPFLLEITTALILQHFLYSFSKYVCIPKNVIYFCAFWKLIWVETYCR